MEETEIARFQDRGIDINSRGAYGYTVLHLTAELGNTKQVVRFIRRGANPNLRDDQGRTPADIARNHRNLKTAAAIEKLSR